MISKNQKQISIAMVRFHFVRMVEKQLKRTTPIANKY